jgi:hypothetical protein
MVKKKKKKNYSEKKFKNYFRNSDDIHFFLPVKILSSNSKSNLVAFGPEVDIAVNATKHWNR